MRQAWGVVQLMRTQRHVLFTYRQLNLGAASCRQLLGGLWLRCYPEDPPIDSVVPGLIQMALEQAMVGIAQEMNQRGAQAQQEATSAAFECFKDAKRRRMGSGPY